MSPVWKQIGIIVGDLPKPQFSKQYDFMPLKAFVLVKCPLRQSAIEIDKDQL